MSLDNLLRGSPGAGGVAVWRGRFLGLSLTHKSRAPQKGDAWLKIPVAAVPVEGDLPVVNPLKGSKNWLCQTICRTKGRRNADEASS
jgi:hypothetical protein